MAKEEPAFPLNYSVNGEQPKGLTKREWFAGMAMQGMLANSERAYDFDGAGEDAFRYADAMIAASKK